FVFLKPLLGLVFNSQKCCHTFVNWYKLSAEELAEAVLDFEKVADLEAWLKSRK
ncbi:MAG: hypothetical protein RLZZ139_2914, partial [Cyanobacteriota bacterium]